MSDISEEVKKAVGELLDAHPYKKGSILVMGCSSSEIDGGLIGHNSNGETGRIVFEAAREACSVRGIFLACQCCEHLNRALVVEEECAEQYGLEPVSVIPWLKGGGSFASAAYRGFKNPVVVEHIQAHAGIDIGSTLIGMHLKHVAVPVRLSVKNIGSAYVTAAYTRPKLIGGERARYTLD